MTDSQKNTIEISLQYIFQDTNYVVDAKTILELEFNFIKYIEHIAHKLHEKIQIKFLDRQSVNTIDNLKIIVKNNDMVYVIINFIIAFFDTKNLNKHLLEIQQIDQEPSLWLNIKYKLKQAKLSKTDIHSISEQDKHLIKYTNGYFHALKQNKQIKFIQIAEKNNIFNIKSISATEFDSYIIPQVDLNKSIYTEISHQRVFITAPVLTGNKSIKWSGNYNNQNIKFYIQDYDFLNKVANGDIKFNAKTFIYADIEIKYNIIDSKKSYKILKVRNYDDDNQYILNQEKVRVETKQQNPNQMSLFDFK